MDSNLNQPLGGEGGGPVEGEAWVEEAGHQGHTPLLLCFLASMRWKPPSTCSCYPDALPSKPKIKRT